jgi:plasmid rolling circle replication initiator protein Rep
MYDFITNDLEMQVLDNEKYTELAARVEHKNHTAYRFKNILNPKQYKYFQDCGTFIGLSEDEEYIVQANFCKLRCCPVCNKRNSVKKWHAVKSIAEELNQSIKPIWLFLTLTVENVPASNLNATIDSLMQSINRLFSRSKWRRIILGYFRSLEITFNSTANTYHPHFHILLAVPSDYFENDDIFISSYEWRRMWEQSARLDYVAQVHIEQVKSDTDISGAIAEVAKYAVKMAEIAKVSETALKTILTAIKGRRLISYGGIIAKAHKRYEFAQEDSWTTIKDRTVYNCGDTVYFELVNGKYKAINFS